MCAGISYADNVKVLTGENIIEHVNETHPIGMALDDLVNNLSKEGHEITKFFSDERFAIYEDIGINYRSAPEKLTGQQINEKYKEVTEEDILEMHAKYSKAINMSKIKSKIPEFIEKYDSTLVEFDKDCMPKEIIVGNIGVESQFNKNPGGYYAIKALVSTVVMNNVNPFLSEAREEYFYNELKTLLRLNKKGLVNVFTRSSYAGAIGIPQFMPNSVEMYVDNHDILNMNDAIELVSIYYEDRKKSDVFKTILTYNNSSLYMLAVCDIADFVNKEIYDTDSDYFKRALPFVQKRINTYRAKMREKFKK